MPSTAMSAAALSNSAIALQQAHEAEVRSCKAYIGSFHAETAAPEQAREYARCVGMVYPSPMTGAELGLVKAALIVAFIGMAIGGWKGWDEDGPVCAAMMGLMGFICAPVGVGIVLAILYAGAWLLGVV